MNAESAYLFRHALMRDAAYQLQLPGDRAKLHALAFAVIEEMAGGPAPEAPEPRPGLSYVPHPADPFAEELALHAASAPGEDMIRARKLYLRRAAEQAELHFRGAAAVRLWQVRAGITKGYEKGESLRRAARVAIHSGNPQIASQLLDEALSISRDAVLRRLEGVVLNDRGALFRLHGEVELALQCYLQSLAISREVGDRTSEGVSLTNLAVLDAQANRIQEAEKRIEEALRIHREVGNLRAEGTQLSNLGALYAEALRFPQAKRATLQALKIHRKLHDRRSEGIVLSNLAILFRQAGRIERAENMYNQALAIHREIGERRFEAIALGNLANLFFGVGRIQEAESMFDQALRASRDVGDRDSEGNLLRNRAQFYQRTGRALEAELALKEAILIHHEIGNVKLEGCCQCEIAEVSLALESGAESRESWLRGAAILRSLGELQQLESRTISMREACTRAGVPPFDEAPA